MRSKGKMFFISSDQIAIFSDDHGDTRNLASLPAGRGIVQGSPKGREHRRHHRRARRSERLDHGDETAHRPRDLGTRLPRVQPGEVRQRDLSRVQGAPVVLAVRVRAAGLPGTKPGHARAQGDRGPHCLQLLSQPFA